ncbi:hypothetical protein [Clavibacter zhangzhiyongii]
MDGEGGFRVPHRRKVSFGTYFNAFPAAYWRAPTRRSRRSCSRS